MLFSFVCLIFKVLFAKILDFSQHLRCWSPHVWTRISRERAWILLACQALKHDLIRGPTHSEKRSTSLYGRWTYKMRFFPMRSSQNTAFCILRCSHSHPQFPRSTLWTPGTMTSYLATKLCKTACILWLGLSYGSLRNDGSFWSLLLSRHLLLLEIKLLRPLHQNSGTRLLNNLNSLTHFLHLKQL